MSVKTDTNSGELIRILVH